MLHATYFDGKSSRPYVVALTAEHNVLQLAGAEITRQVSFAELRISERLGSAPRLIRFADGAFCEVSDLDGLTVLLLRTSHREGLVERLQRRLPTVLAATLLSAVLIIGGYRWGLPVAADVAAQQLPPAVGRVIGEQALQALDRGVFVPSKLDAAQQQRLRDRFSALHLPQAPSVLPKLLFRSAPSIGANAFTLSDGSIVVLDQLVRMLGNDDQTLAVLAHELGHVQAQHPLRLLIEGSAVAAFWAFYVGDISSLLVAAPVAVLQARYSRSFEQDADDYAADILYANGLSPGLLADALEKISTAGTRGDLKLAGGYLSTHPADHARIARLRAAAGRRDI
ncbi:MAG: peptidase family protein [Nevskia sp.]|nr:peptidase family protein [Nevskia sp.]